VAPVAWFSISRIPETAYMVVPIRESFGSFCLDIYELLGLKPRLIFLENSEYVVANRVYVPLPHFQQTAIPEVVVSFRAFLWNATDVSVEPPGPRRGSFLNRASHLYRHIENTDELLEIVRTEIPRLEWYLEIAGPCSFRTVVVEMRKTFCLVSPEGSQIGRLMVMPPESLLAEIMHGCQMQPNWFTVTRALYFYYVQILVKDMLHSRRPWIKRTCPIDIWNTKGLGNVVSRELFRQGAIIANQFLEEKANMSELPLRVI
jgi:hypothetical protein